MYLNSHKFRTALWSCFISGLVLLVLMVGLTINIKKEFSEMVDYDVEAIAIAILAGAEDNGYTEDPFKRLLLLDQDSFRSPHYESEEYVVEDEKSFVLMAIQKKDGTYTYINELYWIESYEDMLGNGNSLALGDRLKLKSEIDHDFILDGTEVNRWELRAYRMDGNSVFLAINQTYHKDEYIELIYLGAAALPVVALIVAFGGWGLGHFAVKPITSMSKFVSSIRPQDLAKRMPQSSRQDEIGELARLINAMLDRIENGYEQAKRFTADASHELRTPLAILQGELEAKMREPEADNGSNARMLEEIRRLKTLTHSLLFLSKTDSGTFEITRSRFDLNSVVRQTVDDFKEIYRRDGVSIEYAGNSQHEVFVHGDPSLIQQVIMNLLRNAVNYNQRSGKVECSLSVDSEFVRFAVGNTGPEIPREFHEKIFERFFRLQNDRSCDKRSSGLGLNLAREIARVHGGDVELARSKEGWTEFEMSLPCDH